MFDTVGMFLGNSYLKESLINNSKESYDKSTGEVILTGTLENLRIKNRGNNISIIGSLPKFYFGDNIQTLSRKDTQITIEKITDLLNLPIDESKIFRLDIGNNFIMNLPLQNYYTCLGELSRFKKSEIANKQTLLYSTTSKSLQFYDKVNEAKRTKQNIPEVFKQKNVLRYELQLKKRIPGSLKLPEVRAKHLYQENFYIKGINFWKDFYFLIQRVNRLKFTKESLTMVNARHLLYQLAAMQVKAIGEDQLLSMIEANKNQVKHRNQVSRMKELVKSLSNEPEITEPNEAINELDSKIKRASNYYR